MAIGIITGSAAHSLPGLQSAVLHDVETPYGAALVSQGTVSGVDVLHISRHGEGHARLSNHVNHRANIWALAELGARAVISCTACGAVERDLTLGSLIFFDDLHFLSNRLPDGSLCTFSTEAGHHERAHWIIGPAYCDDLRKVLVAASQRAGIHGRDGGCYGHVDGPRFNTASEIRTLASVGVTAVSQTAGPEAVLCGEAEIPFALMGYATDYANGVGEEPTPIAELSRLMSSSAAAFAAVLDQALPAIDVYALTAPGTVYRFHD